MKKFLKALLIFVLIIIALAAGGLTWLCINEYNPGDVAEVNIHKSVGTAKPLHVGDTFSVLTWNIGYAGLGAESDFFMDGGEEVAAADRATVYRYLNGIVDTVYDEDIPIIRLFQEVDQDSARTYGINEIEYLGRSNYAFGLNFCTKFVPYPLPPIGRVNSGILTSTGFAMDSAERIALPCPFKWPVSVVNLKRCMLVSRIPIADSDKELVVVNLHLEAYDDGEGKIAQTNQLLDFIHGEYAKGNYVIAGGDFNQTFPASERLYPNHHRDLWDTGILPHSVNGDSWILAYDRMTPTCRLLNQPYNPDDTENTQYYVIDGFILSPNIMLHDVNTLDCGFENSDHNPVEISVTLC